MDKPMCPFCQEQQLHFQDNSIPVIKQDGTTGYYDIVYCDTCDKEMALEPRSRS